MKKSDVVYFVLGIVFSLASIGVICWIFSNSLADGEKSTQQSGQVKEVVDTVLTAVSGKPVDVPMLVIRKLAHFTEYFIMGICLYLAFYFFRVRKIFVIIPCVIAVIVPIIDENIQLTSDGRTFAVTDMLIDMGGAACGIAATFGICALVLYIYNRNKNKPASPQDKAEEEAENNTYENKEI